MADACAHVDVGCARTLTKSGIILWHHQEGRVNTGWPSPHLVQKVSICVASHLVHGRATTGEDSEYLKMTLLGDVFVMS